MPSERESHDVNRAAKTEAIEKIFSSPRSENQMSIAADVNDKNLNDFEGCRDIDKSLTELLRRIAILEYKQSNNDAHSSILSPPPIPHCRGALARFDKSDSISDVKTEVNESKKSPAYFMKDSSAPCLQNGAQLMSPTNQKKTRRTRTPVSPLKSDDFNIPDDESKKSSASTEFQIDSQSKLSLFGYIRAEIFGADDHGSIDTQVNRTVKNFLSVPRQLERLLFFGLLICLDTFLYVPTFLPLRIAGGISLGIWQIFRGCWRGRLSWPIVYDSMRGLIMAQCLYVLQSVQMSRVYHYIRGQSMIKLYVLIGMVEIFDKLMCSFGQDALDSLYWSTMRCKKRMTIVNFLIVCVQSTLHSLLLFVHITTLTVAVNSSDQALLTLLISNNFAEIKSAVFKKFDKQNLFQLSCHDIVERFKLILFLGMIMLLNISHGGDEHLIAQFCNIFILVFGGEVLADWIKHAFITKFNMLQPTLYEEYSMILARDITSCRKEDNSLLDHTHLVARRLAFATLPLNCVMVRFLQIAAPQLRSYIPEVTAPRICIITILFYLIALATKILTGMLLMAHSCSLQCNLQPNGLVPTTQRSPASGSHRTRKELSLDKLANIARFTLWRGRIV